MGGAGWLSAAAVIDDDGGGGRDGLIKNGTTWQFPTPRETSHDLSPIYITSKLNYYRPVWLSGSARFCSVRALARSIPVPALFFQMII